MTGRRFPWGVPLRLAVPALMMALSCCRSGGPSDEWGAFPDDRSLPRRATRDSREPPWRGTIRLTPWIEDHLGAAIDLSTRGAVRAAPGLDGPWRLLRGFDTLPVPLAIHTGQAALCTMAGPEFELRLAAHTLVELFPMLDDENLGIAICVGMNWRLAHGRIEIRFRDHETWFTKDSRSREEPPIPPEAEVKLASGKGRRLSFSGIINAASHEVRPGFGEWMSFAGQEAECRHDPGVADHELRAYRGSGECRVPMIDARPRRYGLHFIVTEPELARLDAEGPTHFGRLFEDPLLWPRQHLFDDFFGQDRRRRFRVDVTDLDATPALRSRSDQ